VRGWHLEPSDALKLTHCSGLQTSALLAGIDALGYQGERPPDHGNPADRWPGNRPAARNDDASIAAPRAARGRADHDVGLDRPWRPDVTTHAFQRLAADAKVPVVPFHYPRHACASWLLHASMDVSP
jgi:hypothetical protein